MREMIVHTIAIGAIIFASESVWAKENRKFELIMNSHQLSSLNRNLTEEIQKTVLIRSCEKELKFRSFPAFCYQLEKNGSVELTNGFGISIKDLDERCRFWLSSKASHSDLNEALKRKNVSVECKKSIRDKIAVLKYKESDI